MTLAIFDLISLIIIILLAVRTAYIGFISEFFSRAAVIVASIGAIVLYKNLVPKIVELTHNTFFPEILSFLVLFIFFYFIVKIIQRLVGSFFQNESLANFDHALGFFLGIIEGIIFVSILLFLLKMQKWVDVSFVFTNSIFEQYLTPLIGIGKSYLDEFIPLNR